MAVCQFRIDDEFYTRLKEHCRGKNKSVSEYLKELVATDMNGSVATNSKSVATNQNVATKSVATDKSVATNTESVATNRDVATKSVATNQNVATNRSVATSKSVATKFPSYTTEKIPQFDPYTGEPIKVPFLEEK